MELEIRMYPLTVEIGTQICKDIAGLPKHFTLHKLGERAPFFLNKRFRVTIFILKKGLERDHECKNIINFFKYANKFLKIISEYILNGYIFC